MVLFYVRQFGQTYFRLLEGLIMYYKVITLLSLLLPAIQLLLPHKPFLSPKHFILTILNKMLSQSYYQQTQDSDAQIFYLTPGSLISSLEHLSQYIYS